MKIPRFVQGAALILWGWHVGLLVPAIPMAILLEFRHFTNRRWDLERKDFYRVADVTTLLLAALAIYLFLTERASHFLITLVQLTPLLFYPLVASLCYSTSTKLSLDVLVYTLRKQDAPQPEWDIGSLYIGVCLVAMGTNADAGLLFFPAVAIIICWTLWPMRSKRYSITICLLLVASAYLGGTFAHQGIHQLALIVREKSVEWLTNILVSGRDPFKTRTAIGSAGRLKQSDRILFRVDMADDYPLLLQEASYDIHNDNEWSVLNASFTPLEKTGEFSWQVRESGKGDRRMTVYREYPDDKDLIPLPRGSTTIKDFPAMELNQSRYGTVQATGIMPSLSFQIMYDRSLDLNSELQGADDFLPAESLELISGALPTSLLSATTDSDKVSAIRRHFDDFRYTLFQPDASRQDPIRHFLYDSKAGHCEYFATVTVLMLRAAGIPARYAVGYSVQEFDPFTDLFVVRRRHAHAWAIAYLDGSWQAVDTTPSVWLAMEEEQASPLQPLLDFASNILFKFTLWWQKQRLEDYNLWLYTTAALLLFVLAWRILRGRQVTIAALDADNKSAESSFPGADSPFYLIEERLIDQGMGRNRGEPLLTWLTRIRQRELLPLLSEHYALRFDPRGISAHRRTALAQAVDRWLAD